MLSLLTEMDEFITINNLKELNFLAYDDNQEPKVPHFFGVYKRIKETKVNND